MRLIDKVLQSPATLLRSDGGRTRSLPAAGSLTHAIDACTLRYILDRPASRQCAALMFDSYGPLTHPDELVRLPTKPFWLECFPDDAPVEVPGGQSSTRLGFFVEPQASGLAGTIHCVSEARDGSASLIAGRVLFDLVGGVSRSTQFRHRMRNPVYPHLDRLLESAALDIHEGWSDVARTLPSGYNDFLRFQAEHAWATLPLALSFAALLNARSALVQRPSELSRLNAARSRLGRAPLAEHIEVSLNLTPSSSAHRHSGAVDDRQPPRFHFVRGHTVTRAGKTFWRTSHFRGDGSFEPTKTVRVTARHHA